MTTENERGLAVLIAGGTKGIGLATALRLARPGARIFLNYHSDDAAARRAAALVAERGGAAYLVREDIGSMEGAAATVARVAAVTDRLDALIHCSAVPNPGELATQDLAAVRQAIEIGGMALLYLVRASLDILAPGSTVLFLSGNSVDLVLPGHGALAVAKALGECMVRYLAIECAPRGINVNTLRLGPVDTELFRAAIGAPLDKPGALAPATPGGRPLSVEDAAEAAAFLLSPGGAMIRGQTIMVDGGLSTTVRGR